MRALTPSSTYRLAFLIGVVSAALFLSHAHLPARAGAPGIKLYPKGAHTGVAAVDRVLDGAETRDIAQLAGLVKTFKVPCTKKQPTQEPAPPRCKTGEPEGTVVDVFNWASCDGVYLRAEKARETLRNFLALTRGLYAVYQVPATGRHDAYAPVNGFGIVYAEGYGSSLLGKTLLLGPKGLITAIHSGCSRTPEQVLKASAGKLLLPPR